MSGPSIAVYDAHWSTGGGGESYAGGMAEVLRSLGEVTLLSHEAFDVGRLAERLDLDLSGVAVRVIDPCASLERVSSEFDVFINASYRSHGRNGARRGIYVVHFPDRPGGTMSRWRRRTFAAGRRVLGGPPAGVRLVEGFHPPDVVRWQQVHWTDGRGIIEVDPTAAGSTRVDLWIGRFVELDEVRELSVVIDGHVIRSVDIARPRTKFGLLEPLRITIDLPSTAVHIIELQSDASRPGGDASRGDRRLLGVPLVGVGIGGMRSAIRGRASLFGTDLEDMAWLDTYDDVISNSEFTRRWVSSWWGAPSTVLEPPVAMRAAGEKGPIILAVGRFFAPERGHSKKQAEMVEVFRSLVDGGLSGWTLHLVGGCAPDDRAYLEEVRRAANGLPVEFHVDATGAELDDLYSRAAIFWHAAGIDEDLDADPVRAEHFGITTVEAMSAGAVPVVFAAGGQPEIVREGIDGYVFGDRRGWVEATHRLISDPVLRREMAAASRERATRYSRATFASRLRDLLLRSGAAR